MEEFQSLGVGLGYRARLHEDIMKHRDRIEWLEIITDHYLKDPEGLDRIRDISHSYPVVPHGLEMSIGSDAPLDEEYLEGVAEVADTVQAPWVSDHLCFSKESDVALGSLTPVVRTRKKARDIAARARHVQKRLSRPFLLENITYYVDLPGDITEPQLITEILEQCDCGLLLDLNNVTLNAANHGFDAREYLAALPLERVAQVHLAGNSPTATVEGVLLDGHDAPVGEEVFTLLEELLTRTSLAGVLIERDANFPEEFSAILHDLDQARAVVEGR